MNFSPVRRSAPDAAALAQREALVARMAADLVAAEAFADLADAIRLLMWKGYGSLDIAVLADDARQAAMQRVVAREMTRP